jgi:WhiB family redox-sensing transcriptional regulator
MVSRHVRNKYRRPAVTDIENAAGPDSFERALCRQADPELWFPEPDEDDRAAKLICGWCPVRSECLAWAMDANEPYGIYGGLTPDERRRARRLALAGAPAAVDLEGEAA